MHRNDVEAMFFLHLYPVAGNDLPYRRKQHGFDNLDFYFDDQGVMFDGKYVMSVPLPEYAIAEIRTGQFVPTDNGLDRLREATFFFNEAE